MQATPEYEINTIQESRFIGVHKIEEIGTDMLKITAQQDNEDYTFKLYINKLFIDPEEIELLYQAMNEKFLLIVDGAFKESNFTTIKACATSIDIL